MKADEAEPVAVLLAPQRVGGMPREGRVGVVLEMVVDVNGVHAARQLVDVRVNGGAVVERDRGVGDDVVVHWFGWLKVKRNARW